MKHTYVKCDRCGKIVRDSSNNYWQPVYQFEGEVRLEEDNNSPTIHETATLDLCESCYCDAITLIQDFFENMRNKKEGE